MVIGIDIDDTISNTCEILIAYGQEFTKKYLKRDVDIDFKGNLTNHYYIEKIFEWTREESNEFFTSYYRKFIENVYPKALAVEYINKLYDEGNTIILVTARDSYADVDAATDTARWLEKQGIKYHKLIADPPSKADVCKEENIDVFIDDSFSNCMSITDAGIKTYMMDSKYNVSLDDRRIKRVYSWPEIYMLLNEERK